ncbi:MAG: type II secretion system protein N [Sphingomonadaceae bacterium]
MKRLPLLTTVAAVAALSASLAYWGLQLLKPQQRPIAAVPLAPPPEPGISAAQGLFGGQVLASVASNYQLKGVVAASNGSSDSAAIVAIDNNPASAARVGKEIAPGVVVKEVHARYVLLNDNGAVKRLDLPSDAGVRSEVAPASLLSQPLPPAQPLPQPTSQPPQGQIQNQPARPGAPVAVDPIPGFGR